MTDSKVYETRKEMRPALIFTTPSGEKLNSLAIVDQRKLQALLLINIDENVILKWGLIFLLCSFNRSWTRS